jgi:UDP-galactopyranose mutase
MPELPLVVFSHLRWDWVYQRPQHLLSRLACSHPVHFIEEPVPSKTGESFWQTQYPEPGVTVWRPHTTDTAPGFSRTQLPPLRRLLSGLLTDHHLDGCIAWFYTPMAVPLLGLLRPACVVYDCMDELSSFKNAPPELFQAEQELFAVADVVFTGGPSLFRCKQDRHANVHCLPSSVDLKHFAKARTLTTSPADQAGMRHPRLGYFGVIDERMDLPLIRSVARAHPDWQIVMIGPVTKIDPSSLPRESNIHYLGQKTYDLLPEYLAGWDVCLLPFALNRATQYISPTKALEYMAAGKPIVSTPITDVAEPYGDIVHLGRTAAEFVRACREALNETAATQSRREERARHILQNTSWDQTARRMLEEICRATRTRSTAPVVSATASTGRARREHESWPLVIIGAGPTGLSAAYHAGADALLLEQNDCIGGWCRSIQRDRFTWDYAGHIMFSNDQYVHEMYQLLLGDNVHWQDREAWIYSHGVYTRYPFQGSLYGLPPEVIKECLLGAIEARLGSVSRNDALPASDSQPSPIRCAPGDVKDCCGDGVLESSLRQHENLATRSSGDLGASHPHENSQKHTPKPGTFEEFIYRVWGWGIAKHFAIPYNRKLWAVPLNEMETSWLGGRVPMPDLEEMIEGALKPAPKPMGPNARFGYPLRGGFQALMNGFLPFVRDRLRLNTAVRAVSVKQRTITTADGSKISFDHLISTMPLPVLVRCLGDEAPPSVRRAAAALRYVSVRCVNLGVGREALTDKHWIYYPEDTVFHRIFVQGNASPHCNAPGGFALTCEITYSPHKPLPCEGDDLIQRCVADCRRVGLFGENDPVWSANQVDLPHAYVVYDHSRAANVKLIREWLALHNIILAGRYSEWEYYNSDHAFLAGKKAADATRAQPLAAAVMT